MTIDEFVESSRDQWPLGEPRAVAVAALVEEAGISLPEDYLSFMSRCLGGRAVFTPKSGKSCEFAIWSIYELLHEHERNPYCEIYPGIFPIGTMRGRETMLLGFEFGDAAPLPVVVVPMYGDESNAKQLAATFTDLVRLSVPAPDDPDDEG